MPATDGAKVADGASNCHLPSYWPYRMPSPTSAATVVMLLLASTAWSQEFGRVTDLPTGPATAHLVSQPQPATSSDPLAADPLAPLPRTNGQSAPGGNNSANTNPANPAANRQPGSTNADGKVNYQFSGDLFDGSKRKATLLSKRRRSRTNLPSADVIMSWESRARLTSDAGSLLNKSSASRGVSTQARTPIVTDTRVRANRTGQLLAAGSYWVPVRMDLDTMMSKIDSRIVSNMIVIKGPYSSRYGPGFSFVDIQLLPTPRYENGVEFHGSTSFDYQTNGEQLYGRQMIFGGGEDWGMRVSYGHRTGVDYQAGDSRRIPASYKSRDLDVALGYSFDDFQQVEFNYLRLDQTDVEFPGLVFDINYLVTDAFELSYTNTAPVISDHFFAEGWWNRTHFGGDTRKPGKQQQVPGLMSTFFSNSGNDGFGETDVDGLSTGYRIESQWGDPTGMQLSVGTDWIYLDQQLNDREPLLPPNDNNFPVPPSFSSDFGFYTEVETQVGETNVRVGGRLDFINTSAEDFVSGVPVPITFLTDVDSLDRSFQLWSAFVTSERKLTENLTANLGIGIAHRPPTMTELYAASSFIGSLQVGTTFLDGDPLLRPERNHQLDVGLVADYGEFRAGVQGFYSWVRNYITYDLFTPAPTSGGLPNGAAFVNTGLATLAGFEANGEYDVMPWLTCFGTISFIEGRDRDRDTPARTLDFRLRSNTRSQESAPLPGIPPLESRVGIRFREPGDNSRWGCELMARIVDNQDRVARALGEIATPGFTVWNFRTYCYARENLLVVAGVENFTDKFYREHLDYRTGRGVFRPGVSYYVGSELSY